MLDTHKVAQLLTSRTTNFLDLNELCSSHFVAEL